MIILKKGESFDIQGDPMLICNGYYGQISSPRVGASIRNFIIKKIGGQFDTKMFIEELFNTLDVDVIYVEEDRYENRIDLFSGKWWLEKLGIKELTIGGTNVDFKSSFLNSIYLEFDDIIGCVHDEKIKEGFIHIKENFDFTFLKDL